MNQDDLSDEIYKLFAADVKYQQSEPQLKSDYIVMLQVAQYNKAQNDYSKYFYHAGETSDKKKIYFIDGSRQPDVKYCNEYMGYIAANIEQHMHNGFILVYINSGLLTHSHLSKFYAAFKDKLPVQYYIHLQNIYIIHGNMFIKSWFWFQSSIQISVLKRKTIFISKLEALKYHQFFGPVQLSQLPVQCTDSTIRVLSKYLDDHQQDYVSVNQIKRPQIQVYGVDLCEYELNTKEIPIFLDFTIARLISDQKNLESEGIFRVNSATKVDKELEQILAQQQYQLLNEFNDNVSLANFIKRFLDRLSTPLFSFELYPDVIQCPLELELVRTIIERLPKLNQRVLAMIVTLLFKVQLFQNYNRMTSYNLAVCFGGSLIRPKQQSMEDLQYAKKLVAFIEFLITNSRELFPGQFVEQFLTDENLQQQT